MWKTFTEKQATSRSTQCCPYTKSGPLISVINQWASVYIIVTLSWNVLSETHRIIHIMSMTSYLRLMYIQFTALLQRFYFSAIILSSEWDALKLHKFLETFFSTLSKSSALYVDNICGFPLFIIIKIPANTFRVVASVQNKYKYYDRTSFIEEVESWKQPLRKVLLNRCSWKVEKVSEKYFWKSSYFWRVTRSKNEPFHRYF